MAWDCNTCAYSGYAHREGECNAPNKCISGSAYKAETVNTHKADKSNEKLDNTIKEAEQALVDSILDLIDAWRKKYCS